MFLSFCVLGLFIDCSICYFVCMYVCMCDCVTVCVCMYIYMCVCIYICMYICMYVCMYVCVDGWMDGWMDGLPFPICSKGSFICTDRIAHITSFVTPVVEHWLEREIAQWVHPMKDRSDDPSHHERTLLPRSYISLLSSLKLNSYVTPCNVKRYGK